VSEGVPPLLLGLIDDAAVFPPGSAPLEEAVTAHRRHRSAWYQPLVGPLLIPAADAGAPVLTEAAEQAPIAIGLIGEIGALTRSVGRLPAGVTLSQVECPVAKRGEDPQPGLSALLALMAEVPAVGYAEVPLTFGLLRALDRLAEARSEGTMIAAKFRTGGLAAELFPTPVELAAVLCACRDRGFVNILVACLAAAEGGEPAELAEVLDATDAAPLAEAARANLGSERPLWVGFGSCSLTEPLDDLHALGLLPKVRR
jgi:hypothetical protein